MIIQVCARVVSSGAADIRHRSTEHDVNACNHKFIKNSRWSCQTVFRVQVEAINIAIILLVERRCVSKFSSTTI